VGHKFIFPHVPKSAGRAFGEGLANAVDGEVFHLNNAQFLKNTPPRFVFERCDLIWGHFSYHTLPRLSSDYKRVAMIRDPVDRAVDNYDYFMNMENPMRSSRIMMSENWALDDFISSDNNRTVFHLYPTMFTFGVDGFVKQQDPEKLVKRAIDTLSKFHFVGFVECFDESVKRLGVGEYRKTHMTPDEHKSKITDEQRERFRNVLEPEYEIYNTIRKANGY